MIDVDRGEDGDVAVGGVRRVPGPAHPDLQHENVDRRIRERDEGEHGQQLEECQGRVIGGRQLGVDEVDEGNDLVPGVCDRGIGHRFAVDHDPLGETLQVRAGEQAGAQAVGADQALDHAARGGLAVRAGDVDDPIGALRIVEQLEHAPGALDSRLHPLFALALEQGVVDGVGAISVAHREASTFVTATVKSPALANAPSRTPWRGRRPPARPSRARPRVRASSRRRSP